jgi:hypothetical protein
MLRISLEKTGQARFARVPISRLLVGSRFDRMSASARQSRAEGDIELEKASPLDDAADEKGRVFDRADLEHVTAARHHVADLPRAVVARGAAERLAALGNQLEAKDPRNRPLHGLHPTALFG